MAGQLMQFLAKFLSVFAESFGVCCLLGVGYLILVSYKLEKQVENQRHV